MAEARRFQPELFLLMEHVARDPATPRDLLDLISARGRAVAGTMRQLVTEAQTAGEAAPDDPDQLVIAIMACLDGLGRFTLATPGRLRSTSPHSDHHQDAAAPAAAGRAASRALPEPSR